MNGGPTWLRAPQEGSSVLPTGLAAPGPIYIGGLERSGKTTLQSFLASHPNIAIPSVGSNMWTYFYRRFGDLRDEANLRRCLDAMLSYSHIACLGPDLERILRRFMQGPPTYARLFDLFLRDYAERAGKPRWGAQTGLVERYADELFSAYPGLKFVHMVRDPRDRYEAVRRHWPKGKGRAGGAVARWTYSVRLAERNRTRHPKDYLVVRFEDLVMRTEETLRTVCRFLGEEYDPRMLTRGHMVTGPRRSGSLSRSGSSAPLTSAFIGRFRGRVPTDEVAFIQLLTGRLMRACGYQPAPIRWSTLKWLGFLGTGALDGLARMIAWRGLESVRMRFPRRLGPVPDARATVAHQESAT